MEKINIDLDPKDYPTIAKQYSEDELKETLVKMCKFHYKDGEITEARLYSVAGMLESDLQREMS